ncbi:7574_t:CDS:2, partial [Rhizophagus irregularis]
EQNKKTDFGDNRNDELNHIEAEEKINDNNDFDLNDINVENISTAYEWKIIKEAVELLSPLKMQHQWEFLEKKNAKITAPIKDKFQYYLNVSELPTLEEYDPFV